MATNLLAHIYIDNHAYKIVNEKMIDYLDHFWGGGGGGGGGGSWRQMKIFWVL